MLIFVYALIVCVLLFLVENVYHPVYSIQIIQKLLTFIVIPVIAGYFLRRTLGKFWKFGKDALVYGIGFWLLSICIISTTYYLLADVIEWEAISKSLSNRWVNESTFLLAFAYVMFGNSLVEEYFFRWVVFRILLEKSSIIAYTVSSVMFSLYHIPIFWTWFSGYVLVLALSGLFVWWLFFAWLYRKTGGIWGAWIFHIFADLAIVAIGYKELFL